MIYIFLGTDSLTKDKHISEIKNKIFPSKDNLSFDYEVLHAGSLNAETLKKSLVSLPVMSSKRLVLIRAAQNLKKDLARLVLDFVDKDFDDADLILDFDQPGVSRELKKVEKKAKVFYVEEERETTVFDMARFMGKDAAQAVRVLNQLMSDGNHPLQLLGGLVWYWGNKVRPRVSEVAFKKGLLVLQEADLNIKRSRLKPEHTMEVTVLKLSSLIAY